MIQDLVKIFGQKEASKIFESCYDQLMTSMLGKVQLDIFKVDEYLFKKYPEHENKLSMKELLNKEYGVDKRKLLEKYLITN